MVLDTDGAFDTRRFRQLLEGRLRRQAPFTAPVAERIVQDALKMLHLFRPSSSIQLAATIAHLPKYHTAHFPSAEIGMLAIDSVSAFYWPDRFTVEQLRSTPNAASDKTVYKDSPPLQYVLLALQTFRNTHDPVIVMTNWGLNPIPAAGAASDIPKLYRQHLHPFPAPFDSQRSGRYAAASTIPTTKIPPDLAMPLALSHHITLCHSPKRYFPEDTPIDVAKKIEAEFRRTARVKEEFIGVVRTPGSLTANQFVLCITLDDILAG